MKIQFDDLDYQKEAVAAAVRVFEGQTIKESNFTITNNSDQGTLFTEMGIANRIIVDSNHMLKNVNKAQILNRIAPSENLYGTNDNFPQFNIEMETGERVIIVTGCINVLVSRVSGTLTKYNSCIA